MHCCRDSKDGDWKYSMATSISGSDGVADKENSSWLLSDSDEDPKQRGTAVHYR
jgi:hypothetical protein